MHLARLARFCEAPQLIDYKRPTRGCGYCDYLQVCLGHHEKVNETVVQVAPRY